MFNQIILLNSITHCHSIVGSGGMVFGGASAISSRSANHVFIGSGGAVFGGAADIASHSIVGRSVVGSGGAVFGGRSVISYSFHDTRYISAVLSTRAATVSGCIQPPGYVPDTLELSGTGNTPAATIHAMLGPDILSGTVRAPAAVISAVIQLTMQLAGQAASRSARAAGSILSGNALSASLSSPVASVNGQLSLGYFLSGSATSPAAHAHIIISNGESGRCLVVNIQSMAISEYDDSMLPESIIELDGAYYGAFPDGIHLLSGDTDNGSAISPVIRTGMSDYGVPQRKNVPDLYLAGTLPEDGVTVTIITDDETVGDAYPVLGYGVGVNRRAKLPKGVKSRYWGFEITGAKQIDAIEIPAAATARRV